MSMPCSRRRFIAASGSAALSPWWLPAYAADQGPPVARVAPVTDTYFGQSVTDPYRWMEDPKDAEWKPFVQGQADYARRVLDAIPGRAALQQRVGQLSGGVEFANVITAAGPYVFIEKRPAGAAAFRLYVRDSSGKERLLVNPEARKQGDTAYSMNYWAASPDGRYVVVGISPSGSEQAVIEIIETASGKSLPERIDRAQYASPSWAPDGSGFFFNRLAEGAKLGSTDFYKNSVAWFHRLNTAPEKDVKVLARGQFKDVQIDEIEFPAVFAQPGSKQVLALAIGGVRRELMIWVQPLSAAQRGEGGWKPVCTVDDKVTGFTFRDDDIWLVTEAGAPRGRVVHVSAADPAMARARVVVPESTRIVRNVVAARDGIYLQDLDGGLGRLRRVTGANGGKAVEEVKLPFDGSLGGIFTDPRLDGAIISMTSWVRPQAIFQLKPGAAPAQRPWIAQPAIDVSQYASEERYAVAKDGTKIPVSIVYRKGTPKNGSAPAMVDAYGSYAITDDPGFTPRMIAWMEQGGVWATAHVRGGGAYGREWHEAGRLLNKPNTWRDLIAACEFMIKDGWTAADKLTIRGGSAGGITVGRAMTERPDLFAAVISQVGVSNTVRAEFSQNGPPNVPEFGTVANNDGFKGLYEMDSYLHVEKGKRYPAMLLTTGINDPRVDPWQTTKMAARMQATTSSGKPVLLRVDYQAGHGLGSTREQRDYEVADAFAFALWQSGVPAFQPSKT